MNQLRVGIIGCGNMGRRHAEAYRYHRHAARMVCCYDIRPDIARKFAQNFTCVADPSLEHLLARDDIDAVSICTIESQHLAPVRDAANAGKHILLEKPIAMTLEEARAIRDAVVRTGIKFMVAHLFRFDQRCAHVKQQIDSGRIGRVLSIDCRFHGTASQQDRIKDVELSVFVFRGCHGLDLMRWYAQSEAVRVYAERLNGRMRSLGYHSDDALFCLMRFANGVIGSIEVNAHVPAGHPTAGRADMTVIGSEGMIQIDFAAPWYTVADEHSISFSQGNQKDLWFREEIGAFIDHAMGQGPNMATVDDGIAALRISLAAIESAESHRPVQLDWETRP
ncbi:MAG: Gfo/Idh/MocA family oxidoreductase [Phycisphaeraceae bacterium]|nr:Gfo/Idh/MocA family oxidoreductase [Phycisphaeraceae bacterium]